jgi:hypothetical protein
MGKMRRRQASKERAMQVIELRKSSSGKKTIKAAATRTIPSSSLVHVASSNNYIFSILANSSSDDE